MELEPIKDREPGMHVDNDVALGSSSPQQKGKEVDQE